MKMKIFSLMLIAILAMSMVSTASAYGHGDIREGYIDYLSCSEVWMQGMFFTNNPGLSTSDGYVWNYIEKNDNFARSYIDPFKDAYGLWDASLNSKHVFRFWLEGAAIVANSMTIDDVDYSRGLFIAADYSKGTHTAAIYYYDTHGKARTTNFKYSA